MSAAPERTDGVRTGVADVPPPGDERPLGELLSQLGRDVTDLARKEVELAKAELRAEAQQAGKAATVLGGAAVVGLLAAILLSFAAAWGLAEVLPTGLAFLIVGVVYAVAAAVLFSIGKRRMSEVNPTPEQTIQTLKEDARWARARKS